MKLIEVLSDRQQVWTIGGRSYIISRVADVAQCGYETMIFTTDAWYGRAPMLEVWADRPADGFTPFADVARAFAASMGAACSH